MNRNAILSHITQFECAGIRAVFSLDEFQTLVARAREKHTLAFTPERTQLVATFANALLRDPLCKKSTPLQVFAFWTRKSAIEAMRNSFDKSLPHRTLAVGRGVALHMPPANVDTIFLYSWVIAFLGGNVNVTRLPSALGADMERALDILLQLVRDGGFADAFVHYSINDEINAALSRLADLRFVWGGDEKVRSFERLPLRIDGRALVFPDRYSYSVMDGATLGLIDGADMGSLAKQLFNDLFVFSQMACSSPHILYVVGDAEQHRAHVQRLLHAVDALANAREILIDPAHGVEKFTSAVQFAAQGEVRRVERYSSETMAVELSGAATPSVGGGFVAISYIDTLDDLASHVETRDQTLSYFGFARERMEDFARLCATRGLCRIVPIGQSLSFDAVWDGYDLLRDSVRLIRIM